MRRWAETTHLTVLGVWLGALVMTGAAAARLFPVMHELDPSLAAYPSYDGEHWSLGAGVIAAEIFFISDIVQFICAFLSFATLGVGLMLWVKRSVWGVIRAITIALGMALVSYHLFVLTPEMNVHLDAYWVAASSGDNEAAATAKASFDAMHPIATKVMGGQAILVFIALVTGCLSALEGPRVDDARA